MGGKQGRMAHKKGAKSDKQAGIVDEQDGTADTLWRMQTDEQLVDHDHSEDHSGQRGGSGDKQDGVRVENHAKIGRSGMDDKQGGMNSGQDSEMTNENDGMTDEQGVMTDTLEVAATDARDPVMQLGIMIYQNAVGQSYEAKDLSSSEAGDAKGIDSATQPSGLEIDCSKPLSDALQNVFSNNYSIIITLPPTSVSHIRKDLRNIRKWIQDHADAELQIDSLKARLVEVQVQRPTYKMIIEDILEKNDCEHLEIHRYKLLTENDSLILAINDSHEAVFKRYPGDGSVDDDCLFIKVLFVKPSFDRSKELTILINWNTKLPLGKSKDGIRVTGISLHENQHLPSNSASNLEAVDFSDEDASTSPFHWLAEILDKINKHITPGDIGHVFREDNTDLVTFYLLDDEKKKIARKPDTEEAFFAETGIKFKVEPVPWK